MPQKLLLNVAAAIAIALAYDAQSWIRARREAKKAGRDLPAYEWESLADRCITAVLTACGVAAIPEGGSWS